MDQMLENPPGLQEALAQAGKQVNPLLARVRIPGETFTLPSGGMFYKNGELSEKAHAGEVHIYPMTAIDELVMKSVDKIFSGEAVKEVFERCIPDVLLPGALSAKDIDFLLVALRKVSYGPTIDVTYTHTCEDAKEHTYDVPLDQFLRGAKKVNPTTMRAAYTHSLENGQIVNFRPATYDDVIAIYQNQQQLDARAALMEQGIGSSDEHQKATLLGLMTSICALIDSVDSVTNRAQILEWLQTLPIVWLRELSDKAKDTTDWGVVFEIDLVCEDCKEAIRVPTPLNPISFFT